MPQAVGCKRPGHWVQGTAAAACAMFKAKDGNQAMFDVSAARALFSGLGAARPAKLKSANPARGCGHKSCQFMPLFANSLVIRGRKPKLRLAKHPGAGEEQRQRRLTFGENAPAAKAEARAKRPAENSLCRPWKKKKN